MILILILRPVQDPLAVTDYLLILLHYTFNILKRKPILQTKILRQKCLSLLYSIVFYNKYLLFRTSTIRHIKLFHLRLREWVCKICKLLFRDKKVVREHLHTEHKKSRTGTLAMEYVPMVGTFPVFQCFSQRYALPSEMEGMLSDTTVNSMDTSEVFENSFYSEPQRSYETELQRSYESCRDNEAVLECPYCDLDFKTASSLMRHKRGAHKDDYQRDKALEVNIWGYAYLGIL